jgi:rhodanese-related sulfurtransferase
MKMFAIVAAFALATPSIAMDLESAGEYASQAAQWKGKQIPPGIYAHTAARLAEFFAETKGARTIYAADLQARIANGTPQFLVDTRTPADFAKGHVPGAVNIPLDVLFQPENLVLLPTDGTPVVLICHTGHTASMALGGLAALGYNAWALRFAMMGWNASSSQKVYSPSASQLIYGLGGALEK